MQQKFSSRWILNAENQGHVFNSFSRGSAAEDLCRTKFPGPWSGLAGDGRNECNSAFLVASRAWLLGIHSIGTWAGRRAEQRVQRGSRQRFSSGHLLGACLPYRCCQSAPDKSSSCQWLPRSGGSRPEIWGYKLLEASPLRRVSASFCPFSLPKGPKPPTTSKKGNDSRRSPRLIWQPPRKYPCSHTPIGRVFGLARSLGLRTFPALCRIGVSVSKSDVNPGAGPARKNGEKAAVWLALALSAVARFAIAWCVLGRATAPAYGNMDDMSSQRHAGCRPPGLFSGSDLKEAPAMDRPYSGR